MDQKQFNEMSARLARLETLLEANDAYQPPGAVSLKDMDFGPQIDYSIPGYDQWQNQNNGVVWDAQFDPNQYQQWQNDELAANDGLATSQSAIDAMLDRLGNIETFLSGGSNDTNQSGALDAGAGTGDDGQTGTGDAGGIPEGYSEVTIYVCNGSTTVPLMVIGKF